ncbi:MAG: hypothetical protein V1838_05565 [Patescibacteria group bacterium]
MIRLAQTNEAVTNTTTDTETPAISNQSGIVALVVMVVVILIVVGLRLFGSKRK